MNFFHKIRSCFWQDDEQQNRLQGENSKPSELIASVNETEEIDPTELERRMEEVIEMIIPVMMMTKTFWSFLDDITQAAKELNIEYSLIDNIAYCEGKAKDVQVFEALLQKIHDTAVGRVNILFWDNNQDFPRIKNNQKDKSFVIPLDFIREDIDVILYKAEKREFKFRFKDHVLKVRGKIFDVSMFSEWLEEFTKERKKQKQDFKRFLMDLKLQTNTEKLQICLDDAEVLQKEDILKKASMLEVKCIFDKDIEGALEISGKADKVRCFKSYLQTINPMFSKSLYPKYWDFSIQKDYAEIEVSPTSEEFKGIQARICGTFEAVRLTKLKRIQNRGLMNNYLTLISSEKKEPRQWLFYGTKIQEPEKIYKHSKIGFDLSYASFKGRFAKGLYFPITALDAHGYAYKPRPKTFQVLLADVFVAEALIDRKDFYVIYKNSQSCPLYLLEYILNPAEVSWTKGPEDDYEEVEEIVDLRYTEKFECPLELSTQAWDVLKMEIEILNLSFVDTIGRTIKVFGNESNLEVFSQWLNEFFSGLIMGENNIEEILEKKSEKVAHSILYHFNIGQIMMKAAELGVDFTLSHNQEHLILTGLPTKLESFKAFLRETNQQSKRHLFPKYWDFNIIQPYAEIEVNFQSEEFQEISKMFNYGFDRAQVTRLRRIQNFDLWNNYISIINAKNEFDLNENIARKLLFHGTRLNSPKSIFRNSEIGFDLELAKASGKYGKGIYFSTNSSYSHSFATNLSRTGRYQMLMTDVYTGTSFLKDRETIFTHLDEEYDSLFADEDNFFVLYKNFQAYPLYLVEYTLKDLVPPRRDQRKQKHVIDILSGGQYCLVDYQSLNPGPPIDPGLRAAQQVDPMCLQRIQKEWENLKNDEFIRDNFFIDKVDKSNHLDWLVCFKGFEDTPYEGGLFQMKVIYPTNYPMKPPFIKFLTQIYHPSINEQGIPCLGLISAWSPATELRHILLAISCLLHDPLMEEPLIIERLALFQNDENKYMKTVRDWTLKYAN